MILSDIDAALGAKLWYAALAVTLSLPDICSILEQPPDEAWSKDWKYAGWYDRNVGTVVPNFTGVDCYRLRGGVLHRAQTKHAKQRWDHIVFTTPESGVRMHGHIVANNAGVKESVLTLDIEYFCLAVMSAVRSWALNNADNQTVIDNLPGIISMRGDAVGSQINGAYLMR